MYIICKDVVDLPTEEINMSACLKEKEHKFIVMLLPRHQPIRLYVALPLAFVVALELVRLIQSKTHFLVEVLQRGILRHSAMLHIVHSLLVPCRLGDVLRLRALNLYRCYTL